MSDDTLQPTPPAAIPWYHSAILRGILAAFFTQVIAGVNRKYHVDLNVWGLDVSTCTEIALNGLSTIALAYAFHARTVKPIPAVTFTKSKADALNAAQASDAVAPPVPVSVDPPTIGVKP